MKRKPRTRETKLQYDLGICSKQKDLKRAISLYESAVAENYKLTAHHYNSVLHLCSSPESLKSPDKELALQYGFQIFDQMRSQNIPPTEATITQVARLAAAKNDPDYAFELVKNLKEQGHIPRLRSYGPALFCFCENSRADEAYAVEELMVANGVRLEEAELAALLEVSVVLGRDDRVYEYLKKLRGVVRGVSEAVARMIERWFQGEKAAEVGMKDWDVSRVRQEREKSGGGWHGLGWLGKGKWEVKRVQIGENGVCCGCRENLVCVDIDCGETERFAQSIAGLAMERELKSNFKNFMEWIEKKYNYEAIVDGANIGLYQQNFSDGGFSISQLDGVIQQLYNRNKKLPLIILHNKRLRAFQKSPATRRLLDEWFARGILYATPTGSNDDWYWLYAAVKLKCLLITNDEMRDHIFELLGTNFFVQWKERHQVRYIFVRGFPYFKMPPKYSILIQETERGAWHVPIAQESTDEQLRSWLCITRPIPKCNNNGNEAPKERYGSGVMSVNGKRKERDPS